MTAKEVDDWFARYDNPMKDVVQAVRAAILAADDRMDECIKWQAPTFTYKGNLASFYPKSRQHASLMPCWREDSRHIPLAGRLRRHQSRDEVHGSCGCRAKGERAVRDCSRLDCAQILSRWPASHHDCAFGPVVAPVNPDRRSPAAHLPRPPDRPHASPPRRSTTDSPPGPHCSPRCLTFARHSSPRTAAPTHPCRSP